MKGMNGGPFAYGARSSERLATCCIEIQETALLVAELVNTTILDGRRSWDLQDEYFHDGRSKKRGGESKHNPPTRDDTEWLSLAVDAAPWPIDWKDTKRFTYFAGIWIACGYSLGYRFRWGGNWDGDQVIIDDQGFDDLVHFELMV